MSTDVSHVNDRYERKGISRQYCFRKGNNPWVRRLCTLPFKKCARWESNPRRTWFRKPPLYPTELQAHLQGLI